MRDRSRLLYLVGSSQSWHQKATPLDCRILFPLGLRRTANRMLTPTSASCLNSISLRGLNRPWFRESVPDGECKRFVNASCIVSGCQDRGGARIANHCDAGARERFLKNSLFLLPSGSRGKETVRCDAGLSSSVHSPWGDLVPDVCSFVTFPENVGWKRACVTASKPEASVMSVGSLKAVPMKLIPIGIPSTSAAGTLMIG